MNGERVVQVIKESLDEIADEYYISTPSRQFIAENYDVGPGERHYIPLKRFLTRRDERVFCYELYFFVRCKMVQEDNPKDERSLVFQGELRKGDVGALVEHFNPRPVGRLESVYVPDFVLHQRGTFGNQELVVEVKAHPNLPIKQLKIDLIKLNSFVTRYNFTRAVFLAVNCTHETMQARLDTLVQEGWLAANITQPEKIHIITKQKRNTFTYECWLNRPTLTHVVLPPRAVPTGI